MKKCMTCRWIPSNCKTLPRAEKDVRCISCTCWVTEAMITPPILPVSTLHMTEQPPPPLSIRVKLCSRTFMDG